MACGPCAAARAKLASQVRSGNISGVARTATIGVQHMARSVVRAVTTTTTSTTKVTTEPKTYVRKI